jgi:hypothetical protein
MNIKDLKQIDKLVQKRLKNVVTKDDLKQFAIKDDLKNLATKDDLKMAKEEIIEEVADYGTQIRNISQVLT